MDKLFLSVLNMSIIGTFIIAVIILARIPLKRAPKVFSYCLWTVAGFRLIFPLSINGLFSLIPFKPSPIPRDIAIQVVPHIDSGINVFDNAVSSMLPSAAPAASVNPLQVWIAVGAYIWFLGVVLMLFYSIVSIILLKRRLSGAVNIAGNIYEADNIKTPFVIGLFRPKIYLPIGLTGDESRYIVLHEQTHIRRKDHIIKIFAYFILSLHWFNPFVWVAFLLTGADMEMSCDERVMKELGEDIKNTYSIFLVHMAAGRPILNGSPLAFGEGGMKERVKNILNFRKPSRVTIIVAVLLVGVLTAGLLLNKANGPKQQGSEVANSADALAGIRIFSLENPTEKEKLERLMSVSIYDDGTAELATPMISSYLLPKCTYIIKGDELLIYPAIESKWDEEFYGVSDGNIIARFEFADDKTLVFKSATVPLYADTGAKYLLSSVDQSEVIPKGVKQKLTITTPRDLYSPFMDSMFGFELVLNAPADTVKFTYTCDKGSFCTYENDHIKRIGNNVTTDKTVYWDPFKDNGERYYDDAGMGDILISVTALDEDSKIIASGTAIIENNDDGEDKSWFKFIGKSKVTPSVDKTPISINTGSTDLQAPDNTVKLDIVRGEYRAISRESYKYNTPILIDNITDWAKFLKNYPSQSINEEILQQNFNEEFFRQSVVYAYAKSEGSGSVRLTAKEAKLTGDKLKLFMERTVPEGGTGDMATRICLFGVKSDDVKNVKSVEGIILNKLFYADVNVK